VRPTPCPLFYNHDRNHPERNPKLSGEFCEIQAGECFLPKRCFVDLRNIYPSDDIQLGSYFRSKRVRQLGILPDPILRRLRDALQRCRSLSSIDKEQLLASLTRVCGGGS